MVRVIGAAFLVWKWIGFGLAWVFDQHCTASCSGHVPPGFTFVQPLKRICVLTNKYLWSLPGKGQSEVYFLKRIIRKNATELRNYVRRGRGKKNKTRIFQTIIHLFVFEDAGCVFYCWYVHSTSHGPFEESGGFAQQLRSFRLILSFLRGTRSTCGMWLVEMDSLRCMTPRFAAWQVQQVRLIMFLISSSSIWFCFDSPISSLTPIPCWLGDFWHVGLPGF